jgi:hypothetical protein
MQTKVAIPLLSAFLPVQAAVSSEDSESFISKGLGLINGTVRAYYVTRQFDTKPDQHTFSPGGSLRLETPPLHGVQVGLGYYWQHDFGISSDKPERQVVPIFTGKDVDILGEAYLKFSAFDTVITAGRQKLTTPFANPADAFPVPTLFEGISLTHRVGNFSFGGYYLSKIKDRPSNEFENVGKFSTRRLGVTPEKTDGTIIGNIGYTNGGLGLEGWFYRFSDLFDMGLVQAKYITPEIHGFKFSFGAQGVLQQDQGQSLFGPMDSLGYGFTVGAATRRVDLIFSYNGVADRPGAFRNGAILAPYSYSNTTLFTNNLVSSPENADSGSVYKVGLNYRVAPNFSFLLSHAVFNFNNKPHIAETDIDWKYGLDRFIKNLSLRNRIGIITSEAKGSDMVDLRVQLEYTF